MNWLYRNVICPWQTDKEIKSAEKFIDKMLFKEKEETKLLILRYNEHRNWMGGRAV